MNAFFKLIVSLGFMIVFTQEPIDPSKGELVDLYDVEDVITTTLGQYGRIIENVKSTDIRYVLYPRSTILRAVKYIPKYDTYHYKGDMEFSDCDDRALWADVWLRQMLPGCASFWVVGHIIDGLGHAFIGVVTKERDIVWVEGSPLGWDVFQDIRLSIRRM